MRTEQFQISEEVRYQRAKKQAEDIRSFYYNLACYCVVIPILAGVNLIYMPEYLWFFFSMIGWGIGLTLHAMSAFRFNPFFGKGWEERKLKQFMEEEEMLMRKRTAIKPNENGTDYRNGTDQV